MKTCTKCKQTKRKSEFYKAKIRKDGLQSACKDCANVGTKQSRSKQGNKHKNYVNQSRKYNRDRLYSWKESVGCCVCGERDPVCLDLHHKDPTKKEFTIGSKLGNWNRLVDEIIKCILVCSNCHKKIHAGHMDDTNLPLITREQCIL